MRLEEFEKFKKELKTGDLIKIHYRNNWRGGDGRPHDHTKGKERVGYFQSIFNQRVITDGDSLGISYKAIKSLKTLQKRYVPQLDA